ncbi:MAG TPA: hypothetical protein VGO34_14955 [Alphaproteobacteria bacterium]|jgi:hypothetical protein
MPERSSDHQQRRHEEMSAREMAIKALVSIDAHTSECNRRDESFQKRYDLDMHEIKDGIGELHRRISSVGGKFNGLIMSVGGVLILGLLSIIAYLIVSGAPWQHVVDP